MSSMLLEAGNAILSHFIQFIIGFVLSVIIFYLPIQGRKSENQTGYIIIIAASLLGILFPLGIYGLIPIIGALLKVGFRFNILIPFLLSNSLFNTLIPFFDPSFTWRTGISRIVVAFLAGIIVGVIAKNFKYTNDGFLRISFINKMFHKPESVGIAIKGFFKSASLIGIYLITGVFANLLLQRYGFSNIIHLMYAPQFSFFARYFMLISTKPLFLLAMIIVTTLIDPIRLSAIFFLFKIKGIGLYIGYLSFLAIILVVISMVL